MRTNAVIISAWCILAVAHAAHSQSLQPESYDTGKVGKVSRAQWVDHDWKADLDRYDTNRDGRIEKREFVASFCERIERDIRRHIMRCAADIGRYFDASDFNRNGELERAESERQSLNFFAQNDLNKDGFVTREEMETTARGK